MTRTVDPTSLQSTPESASGPLTSLSSMTTSSTYFSESGEDNQSDERNELEDLVTHVEQISLVNGVEDFPLQFSIYCLAEGNENGNNQLAAENQPEDLTTHPEDNPENFPATGVENDADDDGEVVYQPLELDIPPRSVEAVESKKANLDRNGNGCNHLVEENQLAVLPTHLEYNAEIGVEDHDDHDGEVGNQPPQVEIPH